MSKEQQKPAVHEGSGQKALEMAFGSSLVPVDPATVKPYPPTTYGTVTLASRDDTVRDGLRDDYGLVSVPAPDIDDSAARKWSVIDGAKK